MVRVRNCGGSDEEQGVKAMAEEHAGRAAWRNRQSLWSCSSDTCVTAAGVDGRLHRTELQEAPPFRLHGSLSRTAREASPGSLKEGAIATRLTPGAHVSLRNEALAISQPSHPESEVSSAVWSGHVGAGGPVTFKNKEEEFSEAARSPCCATRVASAAERKREVRREVISSSGCFRKAELLQGTRPIGCSSRIWRRPGFALLPSLGSSNRSRAEEISPFLIHSSKPSNKGPENMLMLSSPSSSEDEVSFCSRFWFSSQNGPFAAEPNGMCRRFKWRERARRPKLHHGAVPRSHLLQFLEPSRTPLHHRTRSHRSALSTLRADRWDVSGERPNSFALQANAEPGSPAPASPCPERSGPVPQPVRLRLARFLPAFFIESRRIGQFCERDEGGSDPIPAKKSKHEDAHSPSADKEKHQPDWLLSLSASANKGLCQARQRPSAFRPWSPSVSSSDKDLSSRLPAVLRDR
ncbi:hypothetical protein Z043_114653 [Scleropages formosus]|uniref:Uncharacterized protein n=1 Tax=Scleropages formosus TaxID=113540 RepID=A0A0P7YHU6_SCLFO|nr:hypothetical protein Z043_114653 [Scleropages formosus]